MAIGFCRSCGNQAERMLCGECETARREHRHRGEPPRCANCGASIVAIYRICYRCSSQSHRTAERHRRAFR